MDGPSIPIKLPGLTEPPTSSGDTVPPLPPVGTGDGPREYEPNRINILQLTIVHSVDRGTLALTCTTPFIEAAEPVHAHATQRLYQYLAAEFERVTAPSAAFRQGMPIYGEFMDPKPEESPKLAEPVSAKNRPLVDGDGKPLQ